MTGHRMFSTDLYRKVERAIGQALNAHPSFLSRETAGSTRAVGDAVQSIISEELRPILGSFCVEYWPEFARRAMADVAFRGIDGCYYAVDVKTHRLDTLFNMPNLISVERLAKFYSDDSNYFILALVPYAVEGIAVSVGDVRFVPIEWLLWDCLTIGALGWGQVQIANSRVIRVKEGYLRRQWMLELCDASLSFYPKEIAKIRDRIERFEVVRDYWLGKKP